MARKKIYHWEVRRNKPLLARLWIEVFSFLSPRPYNQGAIPYTRMHKKPQPEKEYRPS